MLTVKQRAAARQGLKPPAIAASPPDWRRCGAMGNDRRWIIVFDGEAPLDA